MDRTSASRNPALLISFSSSCGSYSENTPRTKAHLGVHVVREGLLEKPEERRSGSDRRNGQASFRSQDAPHFDEGHPYRTRAQVDSRRSRHRSRRLSILTG
jgi:hypothetical protein